jgi:hypothetical protein
MNDFYGLVILEEMALLLGPFFFKQNQKHVTRISRSNSSNSNEGEDY